MKCNKCNSEWNVSTAISAPIKTCPFCGAELYSAPKDEIDTYQGVIRLIIEHGGMDLLRDGKKSMAMFSDLAPKLRKEKTMFSYLVQCNGNTALMEALKKPRSEQISIRGRLAQEMIDMFLITEQAAYSACDYYWEAIGGVPFEDSVKKEQSENAQRVVQPVNPQSAQLHAGSSLDASDNSRILPHAPLTLSQMLTLVQSNAKVNPTQLADILREGNRLIQIGDYERGLKLVKFASDRGSMDANLLLGECYELGKGVSPAWRVAEAFYRRAAVSGSHEAEYRLGKVLRTNNAFGATEWLQKAAKAGHPDAIRLLKNGR